MRIIAVTEYESVAVGLSVRGSPHHDVTAVRTVDELPGREWGTFDVALVALTTASRGLVAAAVLHEHLGPIPCVIVARSVPDELPDGIDVLTPPLDLGTIERALSRAMRPVIDGMETGIGGEPPAAAGDAEIPVVIDATRMPTLARDVSRRPTGRSVPRPAPSDTSVAPELRAGLDAAERLQDLLDRSPALNDRRVTARRIVDAVRRTLDAHSVVLWTPDGRGGFEALASHGIPIPVLEQGPSPDQPLLRSLTDEHAVVVESRGERFSERFTGLPGLRGDTVIAGSLTTTGEVHGVLVVGGDGYASAHVGAIRAMLEQHALELAIATHLELVRRRPAIDVSDDRSSVAPGAPRDEVRG